VEYAGSAVRALSMEGRLTLCNMAIESGARLGMVAPDEATFEAVRGREFAPRGEAFERAVEDWRGLVTDADAAFDRELSFAAGEIAPTVTWGVTPEDALPVTAAVPDPDALPDPARAAQARAALDYMGLRPGQRIEDIRVDRVFIGSCTNARIEDLRAAAAVLAGRRAAVPGIVSPGSSAVKRRAEEEGLDRVFTEAGLNGRRAGVPCASA
jgi:3-isopropylmalate/(R)-2-methylmalate dehydratase large subunit